MAPNPGRGLLRAVAAASACAAIAGAVALGGCGDGEKSEDPTPAIIKTVERSFTSSAPGDCTVLFTQAALEQTSGADGEAAVDSCKNAAEVGEPADSVEVTDVVVGSGGTTATATATPKGGTSDGVRLGFALIDDGDWKIDAVEAAEVLDRRAVAAVLRDELDTLVGERIYPDDARCLSAYFKSQVTDEQIERALLDGSKDFSYEAIRQCFGAGSDLLALIRMVEAQLSQSGISKADSACIAGFMTPRIKGFTLEDIAQDPAIKKKYEAAAIGATKDCIALAGL